MKKEINPIEKIETIGSLSKLSLDTLADRFASYDDAGRTAFLSLGLVRAVMDKKAEKGGKSVTALLADRGVTKATISNSAYSAHVVSQYVESGLLDVSQYYGLTFQQMKLIKRLEGGMRGEAPAKVMEPAEIAALLTAGMARRDLDDELTARIEHGKSFAEYKEATAKAAEEAAKKAAEEEAAKAAGQLKESDESEGDTPPKGDESEGEGEGDTPKAKDAPKAKDKPKATAPSAPPTDDTDEDEDEDTEDEDTGSDSADSVMTLGRIRALANKILEAAGDLHGDALLEAIDIVDDLVKSLDEQAQSDEFKAAA